MNLDFYTEVQDLKYLEQYLNKESFSARYQKLNHLLCELIQDYNLVAFHTLNIEVDIQKKLGFIINYLG